jgi:hypothetical protein
MQLWWLLTDFIETLMRSTAGGRLHHVRRHWRQPSSTFLLASLVSASVVHFQQGFKVFQTRKGGSQIYDMNLGSKETSCTRRRAAKPAAYRGTSHALV